MRIETFSLGWSSRGRRIVEDVELRIRPGETFGLIGPNGSGKSTLLRLMAGLLPRAQGRVELDGRPLATLPRGEIARRIALVAQAADTAERLNAREAVELGRTPWLSPFAPFSAMDEAIVSDALEAVDMTHMAERSWSTLSGGERQRIHIARALAQRPRLLMLDEPTNHLDIQHQLALLRLIAGLDVTVVIALHDLNQAMRCDRIGIMDGGRLISCGPPAEVLTPERLSAIFRVGARALTDPVDGTQQLRFHCLEDHL
ncbi:ABC transporter ATP-binding protein [Paracoccus alkanivorans]|uniref:ABC transporter ATP-binding protein n=1 Tax=Paracoccus alkanivorans TaxID=2116655 RepID=A0A3M0N0P8_9RHOB|nr:ABC transporter ATP-binding protein [Paracoccus alkanivorans]RMC37257.1 ABC transporter ATP-binding protein [Paracoccus alkanivorans]